MLIRVFALLLAVIGHAAADTSKLAKEDVPLQPTAPVGGKNKLCCGYSLVDDQQWALRFYWMAREVDYQETFDPNVPRGGACALPARQWVELYTPDGYYFGRVSERFACALRLEGSGLMMDDRVINYAGQCPYGYGTCFEQLDIRDHPFGRGSKYSRNAAFPPLIPFKSVAVDKNVIRLGEPLYIPEFDGLQLPDGSIHDGCVRADDTGGGIKKRKMDFFVVTYGNFRYLLEQLLNVSWITPQVAAPRCQYLRHK